MAGLREEFLRLLREDEEFRYAVMGLLGFGEVLRRLDANTEAIRRLQEQVRSLQEQVARHSEAIKSLQEQVRSLQEQVAKLQEQMVEHARAIRSLQEQMVKLQEQVAENTRAIRALQEQVAENTKAIRSLQEQMIKLQEQVMGHSEAIRALQRRIDALGARWGLLAEEAFREGMRGILQRILGKYRVERWRHYDARGEVFGYPSLVEADLIIKDGEHILVEIKASASRGDVQELRRIGEYYEKITGVRPRLILVACYADRKAREAASALGIELYTSKDLSM